MIQVFTFTRFIVRNSVQCQMFGVVTTIQQIAGKKFDFHNCSNKSYLSDLTEPFLLPLVSSTTSIS
jgi:hypothetical protein